MRKKCSSDQEKLLKFKAEGQEFAKKIKIIRTIYLHSERSENFLKQNFFNLFLKVSQIDTFRTIRIQGEKNNWDLETCRQI